MVPQKAALDSANWCLTEDTVVSLVSVHQTLCAGVGLSLHGLALQNVGLEEETAACDRSVFVLSTDGAIFVNGVRWKILRGLLIPPRECGSGLVSWLGSL